MFCSKCGNRLQAEERFCTDCGALVLQSDVADDTFELEPFESETFESEWVPIPPQNKSIFRFQPIWWLPVGALLFVLLGLGGYAAYEVKVTNGVEQERQQGEALALLGKYKAAEAQFQAGLRARPNQLVLQADLHFVQVAEQVQTILQSASDLSKQQQYTRALADVSQAENLAKQNQGGLFDQLQKQVAEQKTAVVVAQIKSRIKDEKTVDDLALLLNQLSAYNEPEAQEVDQQIRSQIADIAYNKANDLLQQNQFTEALSEVNQGLTYDANDSKLLSFQATINKQRADFEQAEKQRIEQAMVEQAKEDAMNKTNSVQVIGITGTESQFGDDVIQGQVKNIGTKPIGMITVYYSVYDSNNNQVYAGSTDVYPNYLAPGETGSFNDTAFGVEKSQRVVVTKTTWYVE